MAKRVYTRRPLADRFWEKVDVRGLDECWEWQAAKTPLGYGKIHEGGKYGKLLLAPRVSWELANGPIPDGMCVLHRYDNPRCVNPRHLFLGSVSDNQQDMMKKGRSTRGEKHGNAKLTELQIHEIRRMLLDGIDQRIVAQKYGVSQTTVSEINTGKKWGWLKEKDGVLL